MLDAFIAEIVERQSRRVPTIDRTSGHRLAEDAAFEWLSSGRVGLEEDQFRSMAASVARDLTRAAFLQTDATEVEHWLIEAGLGVKLGTDVVPVHRAVLDHLAGRSMARRDPIRSARLPELREAVARYCGSQREVSERMLSVLTAVGTDLELLARGKRLSLADIVWPFDSTRFATEYLAELRRLGDGPLFDVGVVGRAIAIEVDRELTWIAERAREGSVDATTIVPAPDRVYMSAPDGSNRTPVRAFRARGYRGAEIDIRVPHFAAFARAGEELQTLLQQRSLPHEGPDIVYERLCSLTGRFIRTVTRVGQSEYQGYSESDFRGLTASGLHAQLWGHAGSNNGRRDFRVCYIHCVCSVIAGRCCRDGAGSGSARPTFFTRCARRDPDASGERGRELGNSRTPPPSAGTLTGLWNGPDTVIAGSPTPPSWRLIGFLH